MQFSLLFIFKLLRFALIFFFCVSCAKESSSSDPLSKLTAIPIPAKNVEDFSEVFEEVSYMTVRIPSESSIGQADKVILTEDHIFIGDFYQGHRVVILDKEGIFMGNAGSFGEGPGEYTQINDFDINHEEKTIVILSTKKVLYFDFDGKFVKEFLRPLGGCYKLLVSGKDYFIFYVPNNISSAEANYKNYILFNYEGGKVRPFLSTLSKLDNAPFFAERNNLALFRNQVYFTKHFSDTIYVLHEEKLVEKMYLDFEPSKKFPLEIFDKHDSEVLNNLEYMHGFMYHMANMHVSGNHLITCFRENNHRSTLIYNTRENTSFSVAIANNDLDDMLPYLNVKYLKDNQVLSCHYPEEFLNGENVTAPKEHPLLLSLKEEEVDFVLAFYRIK